MNTFNVSVWISSLISIFTLMVFKIDFWVLLHGKLPIYKFLAWPGVKFVGLFSEEINYWPKLALLIFGQFVFYLLAVYFILCLWKIIKIFVCRSVRYLGIE